MRKVLFRCRKAGCQHEIILESTEDYGMQFSSEGFAICKECELIRKHIEDAEQALKDKTNNFNKEIL